jgi:hypothetical protein
MCCLNAFFIFFTTRTVLPCQSFAYCYNFFFFLLLFSARNSTPHALGRCKHFSTWKNKKYIVLNEKGKKSCLRSYGPTVIARARRSGGMTLRCISTRCVPVITRQCFNDNTRYTIKITILSRNLSLLLIHMDLIPSVLVHLAFS